MTIEYTRITKKYVEVRLAATLPEGEPTDIGEVGVSLLTPRFTPDDTTAWTAAERIPGYQLAKADGITVSEHDSFAGALTAWQAGARTQRVYTRWQALIAGPDADPTSALVVTETDADLWARVSDVPEVDAVLVDSIRVE